jgi:hypothetical protein
MTVSSTTRQALVCRSVNDANKGGVLEDVAVAALIEGFKSLRLLEPAGAARIEDPSNAGQPKCLTSMPKSIRLLRVTHSNKSVGIVVPTFKGGKAAQRDGIISEASGNPADRSNLHRFFSGGTIGWD